MQSFVEQPVSVSHGSHCYMSSGTSVSSLSSHVPGQSPPLVDLYNHSITSDSYISSSSVSANHCDATNKSPTTVSTELNAMASYHQNYGQYQSMTNPYYHTNQLSSGQHGAISNESFPSGHNSLYGQSFPDFRAGTNFFHKHMQGSSQFSMGHGLEQGFNQPSGTIPSNHDQDLQLMYQRHTFDVTEPPQVKKQPKSIKMSKRSTSTSDGGKQYDWMRVKRNPPRNGESIKFL